MLKSKLRAKICLLLCVVFAFVAVTCFSACKGDDFEIVQSILKYFHYDLFPLDNYSNMLYNEIKI